LTEASTFSIIDVDASVSFFGGSTRLAERLLWSAMPIRRPLPKVLRGGASPMTGLKKSQAAGSDSRIRARNTKRILDAAITIFAQKGFDGTSIAEIAGRSGLPKANVYYYFKTKRAIYATIIANLIEQWDNALAHLTADREPADALSAYIRAKLDFSRRHTAQSKMFANEVVHGGRFLSRGNKAHIQAITFEKAKVFEGWMKSGKMDPVHPMHLFILLWAATQFYADFGVMAEKALNTNRISGSDYAVAAETLIAIILRGCGIAVP
jgi:AcrR family transcriptional regulator